MVLGYWLNWSACEQQKQHWRLCLLVMNVNWSRKETSSVTSGFQTTGSDSPLKLVTTVCMYLLASALSLQIYKQNSDLLLKKRIKKKSDFKLTGRNKCFISINRTRKSFVSEYLIVGTFRNSLLQQSQKVVLIHCSNASHISLWMARERA